MTAEGKASKRRGLGMGLSALLGADPGGSDPSQAALVRMVPIAFLTPSPMQPRRHFDQEELARLAESLRDRGVLQPLVVRPAADDSHGYEIIAGERRWRAAQIAGLHDLPVIVRELDDRAVLEVALVENLQREDLTAIEEAEAFQRLIHDYGHTQEALAAALGKSRSHIANTLRLLKLSADVRQLVLDGRLSAGQARALLACDDPDAAARAVIEQGLTVREVESLAAAQRTGRNPAKKRVTTEKDPDIVDCEQRVTAALGLRVDIKPAQRGGTVAIRYSRADQLESLLSRLLSTT